MCKMQTAEILTSKDKNGSEEAKKYSTKVMRKRLYQLSKPRNVVIGQQRREEPKGPVHGPRGEHPRKVWECPFGLEEGLRRF